jgi:hypothetical protein
VSVVFQAVQFHDADEPAGLDTYLLIHVPAIAMLFYFPLLAALVQAHSSHPEWLPRIALVHPQWALGIASTFLSVLITWPLDQRYRRLYYGPSGEAEPPALAFEPTGLRAGRRLVLASHLTSDEKQLLRGAVAVRSFDDEPFGIPEKLAFEKLRSGFGEVLPSTEVGVEIPWGEVRSVLFIDRQINEVMFPQWLIAVVLKRGEVVLKGRFDPESLARIFQACSERVPTFRSRISFKTVGEFVPSRIPRPKRYSLSFVGPSPTLEQLPG